jgi:Ca2+-binding RTX toxin-like protein
MASQSLAENVLTASELPLGPEPPEAPEACAHIVFAHVFVLSDTGDVEWVDGEPVVIGDGTGAFHGTDESDLIINTGGRRTIHGKGGDDCLVAGPGGDQLHGGRGDDVLLGGEGMDKLHGHFGDNVLDGDEGRDVCSPGPGNDTLVNCDIPHESDPSATSDDEGAEVESMTSDAADEGDEPTTDLDPASDGDPGDEPDEGTEDDDEDELEEGADP